MENNETALESLFDKAKDYSNSTIELLKLNAVDKTADVVSSLISRLAIFLTLSLSLLVINIGFALWIGQVLGNYIYGFFIIGGFYSFLSLLLYLFRHQWIKYPVSNSIIKQMMKVKS